MRGYMQILLLLAFGIAGCTGSLPTEITMTQARPPEAAGPGATAADPPGAGGSVAVLAFQGPMQAAARQAAMRAAQDWIGPPIAPDQVDRFVAGAGTPPSQWDERQLALIAEWLKASTLIWGTVNAWTPYAYDGWSPARRPMVELTLWVWRPGAGTVQVRAAKRGGLPPTVFAPPPGFEAVAAEAIGEALASL